MKKIVLSLSLLLAIGIFFACNKSSSGGGGAPTHTYSISFEPLTGITGTHVPSYTATAFAVDLYIDGNLQLNTVAADSFSVTNSAGITSSVPASVTTIYSTKVYPITFMGSGTVTLTVWFHDAIASITYSAS